MTNHAVSVIMNLNFIYLMYDYATLARPVCLGIANIISILYMADGFTVANLQRFTNIIPEQNLYFSCFRTGLLFSTLFTTGMGFLSALSPNYLCLMALRFLVGVGLGGSHVYSSWFLEFVPAQNRGFWMIIFSFFWTIGTVLEASLAWVSD